MKIRRMVLSSDTSWVACKSSNRVSGHGNGIEKRNGLCTKKIPDIEYIALVQQSIHSAALEGLLNKENDIRSSRVSMCATRV